MTWYDDFHFCFSLWAIKWYTKDVIRPLKLIIYNDACRILTFCFYTQFVIHNLLVLVGTDEQVGSPASESSFDVKVPAPFPASSPISILSFYLVIVIIWNLKSIQISIFWQQINKIRFWFRIEGVLSNQAQQWDETSTTGKIIVYSVHSVFGISWPQNK